jgi:hypothetical protein
MSCCPKLFADGSIDISINNGWTPKETRSLVDNPFQAWLNNNHLYIDCSNAEYELSISVVEDYTSNEVFESSYPQWSYNCINISIEDWGSGAYTITIRNDNGGVAIGHFFKE